ncbi:hypothetical protein [Acidovorax sp.]|uniref:hypothetical protein n=1 Tax=Acidovorax sp. TaxID=1872122 RepID=UPI00391F5E72
MRFIIGCFIGFLNKNKKDRTDWTFGASPQPAQGPCRRHRQAAADRAPRDRLRAVHGRAVMNVKTAQGIQV